MPEVAPETPQGEAEQEARPKLRDIRFDVPKAFLPLVHGLAKDGWPAQGRRRYYSYYGGRGGAKSWAFARAIIAWQCAAPLRVLCVREVMRTIADSVHRLISDQIVEMGLDGAFQVKEAEIVGPRGGQILFAGLRSTDAGKLKSYEGIDICWCEEAQAISKKSWDVLIPTIRTPGSEIWASWNPELDSDATWNLFINSPPPDSLVQKVTWRDNKWFPAVLEAERKHLQRVDPEAYQHVWEGFPRTVVEGAIYAREVIRLLEQGRVRPVPYDPRMPVHTVWDLGWNDQTSVIFVQRGIGEVRIIDYEEHSFLRLDEWAKLLRQEKPYHYGEHWLPHDARNETIGAAGQSIQVQLTPLLGKRPKVIPRPATVEVPINAARNLFPRVYMDEERCGRLLECLKRFRRNVPESTGEPGAPMKDQYRHGADAFGYLAMSIDKMTNEAERPIPRHVPWVPLDRTVGY